MKANNQDYSQVVVVIVIFGLVFSLFRILTLSNKTSQLEGEVHRLTYELQHVRDEVIALKELNNIVSNAEYNVQEVVISDKPHAKVFVDIASNKLSTFSNVHLEYRPYYDYNQSDEHNYSNQQWNVASVHSDNGKYYAEFVVPYSGNYELQVAYEENNGMQYESLPTLDIYSKAEHAFMKDINVYSLKNKVLRYDAQVARSPIESSAELLNVVCNIYYNDKLIKTVDLLKDDKASGRKKPTKQLEHSRGDYWFVIDEVDWSDIKDFDESKAYIELRLQDSLGNTYTMKKGLS